MGGAVDLVELGGKPNGLGGRRGEQKKGRGKRGKQKKMGSTKIKQKATFAQIDES